MKTPFVKRKRPWKNFFQSLNRSSPDCDINLADTNRDGSIDALDIEPLLGLLFP